MTFSFLEFIKYLPHFTWQLIQSGLGLEWLYNQDNETLSPVFVKVQFYVIRLD